MPFRIGTPELIIVLVIILLLFGVGRIEKIAGELGKGIKAFKSSLSDQKDGEENEDKNEDKE
jgi:sec-independent protein translocase protein TatA